ncbi:pseudouridine synthase 7 isoform X1 [Rhynchophorus ferrugineus]|uniref:pseudouridine synthase 7 isoform X1 n=1 Tax=Rhynchophorus ferrugineus TaxID=354439 RepID=UPI003FCC8108
MSRFNKRNNKKGFNRGPKFFNRDVKPKRGKQEYRHKDQLTEEEVGISEYISDLEGYEGIIKARFSDFQVSEINLEGKMAKLTDTTIPKDFCVKLQKFSPKDTEKSPAENIPQEIWEAVKKLAESSQGEPIILNAENFTKDDRRTIHECIKSYFGQKIIPSTITKDEKTVIEFKRLTKDEKPRFQWPSGVCEYVYFIVYKEMMDTMEASLKISQALRMPNKITYAGVKDRRAKTSQWFCIQKVQPYKLLNVARHVRNLKIGNLEFKDKSLSIGDLKGNRFRIALRNVKADDDLIMKSVEQIKNNGFINYYGLQRFGNEKEVPTFLIGIKLLLGQWKEAIDQILKVKSGDDPELDITKAKQKYADTGDAAAALKLCENSQEYLEFKLLQGLVKSGKNNYVTALENIPRNTRLMYTHAFQSLIWNKIASRRLKEFGMKPVEGDLVYVDSSLEETILDNNEDLDTDETTKETDKEGTKPTVKALTANELGDYSIYDILLPLPGYNVIYPEYLKQYYKEAIEEHGLQLEMPKQSVKTYNLSGTYRKLLGKPEDLESKIMYYNDPTDNLILSDLDELKKIKEPESVENGKYKAVILSFTLRASSYATMVLREILKCNTSSSKQAELNNYGEVKTEPKVIVDSIKDDTQIVEEHVQTIPGSLLNDKKRYEDFKNNLFKNLIDNGSKEPSSKRNLDCDGVDDNSMNKKSKTD